MRRISIKNYFRAHLRTTARDQHKFNSHKFHRKSFEFKDLIYPLRDISIPHCFRAWLRTTKVTNVELLQNLSDEDI